MSYLRAFRQLGYEPLCFDMTIEYEKTSCLTKNRYTNRIISNYAKSIMNNNLLTKVNNFKPDLIFVHKGQYIYPETLKKIKSTSRTALFIFNPDDPFNKNRGASSEFIRKSISIYDLYFIWSKTLIPKLKQAGARKVEYLPFACDPGLHYPISLTDNEMNNTSDVVFVGNWDREREQWLSELDGYNLAIWGADYWEKRCKDIFLKSCWKGKTAIGEEMSKIVNSSKINLNILRLQNKGAHNMRTFEVPACGGFMFHERSGEVQEFFEEGKEMDCFGSAEEFRDKIVFYLKNDNLRVKIAEAGYQRLLKSNYFYSDRVKSILTFTENY